MSKQIDILPFEVEVSILQSILDPLESSTTFKLLLERQPTLYGTVNSTRRRAVTNRKYQWKKLKQDKPAQFLQICREHNLIREATAVLKDERKVNPVRKEEVEETQEEEYQGNKYQEEENLDSMNTPNSLSFRSPTARSSPAFNRSDGK